jgi:hypothetical protein
MDAPVQKEKINKQKEWLKAIKPSTVLRIRDILVRIRDILARIRIHGSVPLTSGSGSGYFRHVPSQRQQKTIFS